ncbi:hypothetical protein HDU92_004537 [Lobulomyces angularis]|nr:hypothetical protein HDU92_004537 [Lobulomyces angularis]
MIIKLSQIGTQLATLEIVNEQSEVIQYPHGFRIHDDLYNEDVQMANGVCVIISNASYKVSVNNVPRARLFNQRQVAVFKARVNPDGVVIADEPATEEPNIEVSWKSSTLEYSLNQFMRFTRIINTFPRI